MFGVFITLLPKAAFSRLFGYLATIEVPIFTEAFRDVFCKLYTLDESEMQRPIKSYASLQKLFTRKLKEGARPLADSRVISPVDGVVSQGELIGEAGKMIQAKGRDYKLSSLLADSKWAEKYEGGCWATIYLAPFNYHRIHTPVKGEVTRVRHIPGQMWPVNKWSVENVAELFCVNERIISEIETPEGNFLMVKVAATNVGCITLDFLPSWWSANSADVTGVREWDGALPSLKKGEGLGCFELGSTVVIVADKKFVDENPEGFKVEKNQEITLGTSIS